LEGVATGVAFVGAGIVGKDVGVGTGGETGIGVGTGVGVGVGGGLVATGVWLNTEAEKKAISTAIERDFNMGLPTSRIKTRRVRPF